MAEAAQREMPDAGRPAVVTALAAEAIAIGSLANTLLKLLVAAALGAARFRRVVTAGLAGLAAALVVALWLRAG